MNLPKPKKIPVTFNYTAETIGAVASVAAVTYTADAMFEQFQLSDKILSGITLLNSNFVKMMTLMTSNLIKSDQKAEEDDMEKKQGPSVKPTFDAPKTDVDVLLGSLSALVQGFSVLVGAAIVTMLDESKKKLVKGVLAWTVFITSIDKELTGIVKVIRTSLIEMRTAFTQFTGVISSIVKYSVTKISELSGKMFRGIVGGFEELQNITKKLMLAFENGKLYLKSLTEMKWMKTLSGMFKSIEGPVVKFTMFVSGILRNLTKGLATIIESKALSVLGRFAPIVSKIMSKFLWPIQLVLSAVDFINGFMEGYAEEGILEGLKRGVQKLFEGFFGSMVEIVDWALSGILSAIGLEETSKTFSEGIKKNWEDVKTVFKGILDIFKGVATLDPKLIWEGITGVGKGMKDFFIDNITSALGMFASLFKDITGVDLKAKVTKVIEWFKTEALDQIEKLFGFIVDNIIGAVRWLIEKTVPFGTDVANKLFGARDASPEELDSKAKEIAKERHAKEAAAEGKIPVGAKRAWFALGKEPEPERYMEKKPDSEEITEQDREASREFYRNQGRTISEDRKDLKNPNITSKNNVDTIQSPKVTPTEGLTKALEQKTKEEKKEKPSVIMNNQNNVNNSSMNRSSSGGVIMLGANEKASFATPASRYSVR